ncbi:MAG: hypothetical protein WA110_05250, partial [Anaerolineaceae bacterium]
PAATLQPLRVQVTPLLSHWLARLNECSEVLTQSNLLVEILPPGELDYQQSDLVLRLGEKSGDEAFLSFLGDESIIFIKDPANPVTHLTSGELSQILTGAVTNWNQVPSLIEAGFSYDQPVELFVYEQDNELTAFLDGFLPVEIPIREDARQAFSADMMLDLVTQTPGSIGMILNSQAGADTAKIQIRDEPGHPLTWQQHVLAVAQAEPAGDLRQLLLCLQSGTQP